MTDHVNHPAHYGGDSVYECLKVLEAWLPPEQLIGFCRGSAIKYLSRAGRKNGEPAVRDLAKAGFYAAYERDFRMRLDVGKTGEARVASLLGRQTNGPLEPEQAVSHGTMKAAR